MKRLALIVAATILTASPAFGEAISGQQFMQRCAAVEKMNRVPVSEEESVYATFCLGYITGFVDSYDQFDADDNLKQRTFCLPTSAGRVTNTGLVGIVLQYLEKNPEKRNLPIGKTVSLALEEVFPCN